MQKLKQTFTSAFAARRKFERPITARNARRIAAKGVKA